ncbi:MAG: hypothetical protein RLN75_09425, partial [Longimicrobiales bacterium]
WAAALETVTRPAAPVAGVAVALPVGSGADAPGLPGAGQLAADAVVAAVEARLGPGEVEGRARVEPDRTVLTFLVRPERIGSLFDALGDAAWGPGPGSAAVQDALRRRSDVLRFEHDSPLREVDVERRTLLYGAGDPRTRPPGGILAVIDSLLGPGDVETALRTVFARGEARVVVVGPVASAAATAMAGRTPPPDTLGLPVDTAGSVAAPSAPAPEPATRRLPGTTSAGPAWTTGDRRVVTRPVTSTWLAVAFPVPADLPRIAVLYVADRMHRELNATPPDPGLFSASVEVVEMPEGEVLLVRAAVLPEAAPGFEARILALADRIAAERDPSFFRFHRGRFRAARLIEEAPPEAAATRMAAELLTRGEILEFDEAVWSLSVGMAVETAGALGPPRILVFGPDLGGGGNP